MERTTLRGPDGTAYIKSSVTRREAAHRLAAYEDTGLEPEEITAIIGLASENCAKTADKIDQLLSDDKELGEYRALGPIDRIRELTQAYSEGAVSYTHLYAVEINGRFCGAFVFFIGEEPTYRIIEDGAWIDDGPYGTIHRVASDGTERGIFER